VAVTICFILLKLLQMREESVWVSPLIYSAPVWIGELSPIQRGRSIRDNPQIKLWSDRWKTETALLITMRESWITTLAGEHTAGDTG